MSDYKSITVTEQLLPSEDFHSIKSILRDQLYRIQDCDNRFYALVTNIIVGEDQQGEIIEAMKEKTDFRRIRDHSLIMDTSVKINRVVNNFNDQIDDMKTQRLTITYEDTPSV